MSLVRAELRRLVKRRFSWWMLALVVALLVTVAGAVAATHQQPGPGALAAAQAEAQRAFDEQLVWIEQDFAACEDAHASGDSQGWPTDCQEVFSWASSVEEMVEWYMPPTFDFRNQFPEMIHVLVGLLAMLAFTVGASYVGAEWRTGGMMNLLLWQPRRLLVFGAKLGSLLATLTGLTLLLGAVWTGGFWLIALARGITDTTTAGAWQSLGLAGLRGLVLVLVAGAIGFAVASIGRHTAAAMGAAIAAFVVGVAGLGIVLGGLLQVDFFEVWLWPTYVAAWLEAGTTIHNWGAPCQFVEATGECLTPTKEITWQAAGLGIAGVVALVVGAAMWQMRRRDVA